MLSLPTNSFFGTLILVSLIQTCCTAAIQQQSATTTTSSQAVAQNPYATAGPFPILEIGYKHIISQIGSNATASGNSSLPESIREQFATLNFGPLQEQAAPAQCGPGQPCADASCCNSDGKCGYTSYTCDSSAGVTCLSNCNARAECGVNSLNGDQRCPLNICCSHFGYCGTSNLYCGNPAAAAADTTGSCQQGYGSCRAVPPPSCDATTGTASKGRKVGYYQANAVERQCNRMGPNDIDITGFTHLIFTFASIDPNSFHVIPSATTDEALYAQFTTRKSPSLQTWISVGGYAFSNPGPTEATWSSMVSSSNNRAAFISSLITFMTQYGFQGVDLDWEFPAIASRGGKPSDTANFVSLAQEMRSAFGSKYGISIALPPDFASLQYFNPSALASSIDFFNFMSYDLHGPWEAVILGANVRAQSSVIDISSDLLPLWFDTLPPAKVNFGIPYYGRGFTLQNPSCTVLGCPYTGASSPGTCTDSAGVLSLREIEVLIQQKSLVPQLLSDEMIKQISWGNQWIGYDDADTINLKSSWANQHCLGGMVYWSLDLVGVGSGDTPISPSTDSTCSSTRSCLSSSSGPCCSTHGFCGSDAAHCSVNGGCQVTLGTCNTVSIDGSCGVGKTCTGSGLGDCCSAKGWCGSGDQWCGTGCQPLFGTCR